MTGPEHYRAAERLLQRSLDSRTLQGDRERYRTEAQVHATLALAAATVDAQRGGTAVWGEYPAPVEGD